MGVAFPSVHLLKVSVYLEPSMANMCKLHHYPSNFWRIEASSRERKVLPANLIAAAKQTQAHSFRTMFKICREVSLALCLWEQ